MENNKRSLKKISFMMLSALLVLVVVLSGCSSKDDTEGSSNSAADGKKEYKLAWYASAPHPYFELVKQGVEKFETEYGIAVHKQIGPDWTQPSQSENIEALAAQGFKYFSVYPSDASAANGLYEELTDKGINVISFGTTTLLPTTASFSVSSNIAGAAAQETELLIEMMGGKGNIINVLEVLEDANTAIRKKAIEEVVAKYPDVKIIQEVAGINTFEEAISKVESALSANINETDGILATGFNPSIGIAQVLTDYRSKGGDKVIRTMLTDTDPIVVKAIKEGIIDSTLAHNSVGHGYLSMLLLKYMADGWVPKEGVYQVDGGTIPVTKDNVDTFEEDLEKVTQEIKVSLETKYLEKK